MTDPSPADLVSRLVQGDPVALEDAYREHAARCNAIAYRVLRDEDRARDAVQEAFLSLWRHRDGLVVRSAGIGPWLVVVTRNAAIQMLRRAATRTSREERAATADTDPSAPDPSDVVAAGAESQWVRSAIAALPAEQRAVIEYAYFRYMTMSQIAERTKTPLATIKRRAQIALRQLASKLREQQT